MNQLQPNNEGYAYINKKLADSLHQYYNAVILYLWAEGYSLESINKDYKLPAKMGAINNFSRSIIFVLQRLTKGNMINNNKMDCQPYRKRRPAVKRAAFLRDRERRKTYKETGPK